MPRRPKERPEVKQVATKEPRNAPRSAKGGHRDPFSSVAEQVRLARQTACEVHTASRVDPKTLRIPFTV